MSDFRNFHRIIIYVYGDTFFKFFRNFTDLLKNYTLVYVTGMFEALCLLVYKSDPHSKGYNSISILNFFFRSGASLKVTYNPL